MHQRFFEEHSRGHRQMRSHSPHDHSCSGPPPEAKERSRRYFGRGGVKYALLQLLCKESMHGYQMMKQLEEQSGGMYVPSPGSIYPTLQMLEDQGLVSVQQKDGKKVYNITSLGQAELEQLPPDSPHRSPHKGAFSAYGDDHHLERIKHRLGLSDEGASLFQTLLMAEHQLARQPERQPDFKQLLAELEQKLRQFTPVCEHKQTLKGDEDHA